MSTEKNDEETTGSEKDSAGLVPVNSNVTKMSGYIGSMQDIVLDENFEIAIERLEQFFFVNSIGDDKKVPVLITCLEPKSYGLLRNLCVPKKPSEKTFKEITTIITNHFQPKISKIAARAKFSDRKKQSNETFGDYLAALKELASPCAFDDKLEERLRDQIVIGITDVGLRANLLSQGDTLTYQKCVELLQSAEISGKEAKQMDHQSSGQVCFVKSGHRQRNSVSSRPTSSRPTSSRPSKGESQSSYSGNRPSTSKQNLTCFCCGKSNHVASECFHNKKICKSCGVRGHLEKMCRNVNKSKKSSKVRNNFIYENEVQNLSFVTEKNETYDVVERLYSIKENFSEQVNINNVNFDSDADPLKRNFIVNGQKINFEIDSGSPIALMRKDDFYSFFPQGVIESTRRIFFSYTGDPIKPVGVANVNVQLDESTRDFKQLQLFVVNEGGPPLVGRVWLRALGLAMALVGNVREPSKEVIVQFPKVFVDNLGTFNGAPLKLNIKPDTIPIFCRAAPVPYAVKDRIEKELDRLVKAKVLEPIESSDWASPIVAVPKRDGSVRICGNYKLTLNKRIEVDRHPIPKVQDVFAQLGGGKVFSKLDLSHAYQQFPLDEASQLLTTINTHKGLFKYTRLAYGISSSPGLFQREMERLVQGLEGVVCFLDDILISGQNVSENVERLRAVLKRIEEKGLTLKREKCVFLTERVKFLGHEIDGNGLHMDKEKIKAITQALQPKNVKQLQSLLGMINYYSQFLPNLASVLKPLYRLLGKNVKWRWNAKCHRALNKVKALLVSDRVLMNFDPKRAVTLACDASPYGLGAVLSHRLEDGTERPIAFASRTLSEAEQKYSQIDKEATAIVFGVNKFHQYLWGRTFLLHTDHKPLVAIFGPKKGIPAMCAARLQRYALFLAGYEFDIDYIKSEKHGNADALSRMPLGDTVSEAPEKTYLNYVVEETEWSNEILAKETARDPVLRVIKNYLLRDEWPQECSLEEKKFLNRKGELYLEQDCIMWGHRVVVPSSLRASVLKELHSCHFGISKMKAMARNYFWWPLLDADIEKLGKDCEECSRDNPSKSELVPWPWPKGPNHRLHADFLGKFQGHMFLIIVDAYSKWVEVYKMPDITVSNTKRAFRDYFSRWGIPIKLMTDNGPSFVADEFEEFLKLNGTVHLTGPPYHPRSNGAAENAVKTFKKKLKSMCTRQSSEPLDVLISRFLFNYRNSPHTTTGVSPAELQIGRKLRTRFDLLLPSRERKIEKNHERQIRNFAGSRKKSFEIGEFVRVKDYRRNGTWIKAKVLKRLGSVIYLVEPFPNVIWKRHIDQILILSDEHQKLLMKEGEENRVNNNVRVENKASLPLWNSESVNIENRVNVENQVGNNRDNNLELIDDNNLEEIVNNDLQNNIENNELGNNAVNNGLQNIDDNIAIVTNDPVVNREKRVIQKPVKYRDKNYVYQ